MRMRMRCLSRAINWCCALFWISWQSPVANCALTTTSTNPSQMPTPHTFRFQNPTQCLKNEFYNLNLFDCVPCNEVAGGDGGLGKLQPDKFACKCPAGHLSIYERGKTWPTCDEICTPDRSDNCTSVWLPQPRPSNQCSYRYLNSTSAFANQLPVHPLISGIILTQTNPMSKVGDCISCDMTHNFRYQDFCLATTLLRPYVHYNAFWQATTTPDSSAPSRFGDLKFVAFFCLTLRNDTACQQLANLCVLSHFSLEKHSPCSAFLLTQVSDVVMKYAHSGEQVRSLQPFLFYKKGRVTKELLSKTLQLPDRKELRLFSTTFGLDGGLKRWGAFHPELLNMCQQKAPNLGLALPKRESEVSCQLTLERLIDLANQRHNDEFLTVFLNFSSNWQYLLHQLPVLIETLTPENQRPQQEEWQLVKRFQMISASPRDNHLHQTMPRYEDAHKLQQYYSLRYVENIELRYTLDKDHPDRVGLPLIRLRYRHIVMGTGNTSLSQLYPFSLRISYDQVKRGWDWLILEVALPLLLLLAFAAAVFRLQNLRRRRKTDLYQMSSLIEFLLQLAGNVAYALLATVLMLLLLQASNPRMLKILLYTAFMLQFLFLGIQLWRSSQLELFLIDWERPRSSCEGQRLNLDSSSLCSSVRTFVAESSVSAWRVLFTANAWIRLSVTQKFSTLGQVFVVIAGYQFLESFTRGDIFLRCCLIAAAYLLTYLLQIIGHQLFVANPLQKFIDLCSLANISLFSLTEPGFGYYIHGRSPHGFADTDMSSMILQLQRTQTMCGRRGLLMDSDKQAYVILPPRNLHIYLERLLLPFQRSLTGTLSQTMLYQKDIIPSIDGQIERTSIAYASVNRFFCAFIDHAIKDMDYIIKEKSFVEQLLNCEIDNYITENRGTFYIDDSFSFSRVLLLGNHLHIFVLELLLVLSIFLMSSSLLIAAAGACALNILLRRVFRHWVRRNISRKTLIDERFLL
ncbi:meckelin [Drosophila erecta]|uniref:GG15301 n=1 Tax=Drosophila erecta TaxID=7220 RepID=B3NYW3_DROER|nr:meckelin [Drosophila erecta]XP_026838472.1 meckelin [Drosophila erecta]XP_026838477.1 meckelin [Drosophila erecta]XP_026838480.1 meckelin [Drosophila erecta]